MKNRLFNSINFKMRFKTNFLDFIKYRKNSFTFSSPKTKKLNKVFIIPLLFCPFIFTKSVIYLEEEKKNESEKLSINEIIRGEYENKIRFFAALEKKFMIFAGINSVEKDQMTYFQFLHCITPFQHMKTLQLEEIEKKLLSNSLFNNILKKIDVNNDKFISFEEFVIWNLMISLNKKELEIKFPSRKMTKEQFTNHLMENLRTYDKMRVTDKTTVDARLIKTNHETIFKVLVEFTGRYFKNNEIEIDREIQKLIIDLKLVGYIYEVN